MPSIIQGSSVRFRVTQSRDDDAMQPPSNTRHPPVLIVGSFVPCIYYGFFCEAHLQAFYLSAITLVGFGRYPLVLSTYSMTDSLHPLAGISA